MSTKIDPNRRTITDEELSLRRRLIECARVDFVYERSLDVRWNHFPIRVRIDEFVPVDADESIQRSVKRWNKVFGRTALIFSREIKSNNKLTWVSSPQENLMQRGETTTKWMNHEYYKSKIIIYLKYGEAVFKDGNQISGPDLESILTHEIGHMLGLDHKDGGIMAETSALSAQDRNIDETSKMAIQCLYKEFTNIR